MMDNKTQRLFRLHCLNRLKKLQAKLDQPDWKMSAQEEHGLLCEIMTSLTLMLHDLGIECYIAEDFETADQLDKQINDQAAG